MSESHELRRQAKAAFEEMKAAEMAMDDMDLLTESPLLKKAMEAAKRWRDLEDLIEQTETRPS